MKRWLPDQRLLSRPVYTVCVMVVSNETMAARPASAVGRRRPVCEYAQKAALLSGSFRFKVGC